MGAPLLTKATHHVKRTTASLLTGALAAGTFAVLATVSPSIASASGCGTTTFDENEFPQKFLDVDLANGTSTVVDGGLWVKTTTTDSDKAAGAYRTDRLPLADYTAESNYALEYDLVSGTGPGYNLIVDINGDAPKGYTTLVKENGLYNDQWWTNQVLVQGVTPTPGEAGGDYAHLGTIQEYSDANPDAMILGFGYSLGRGPIGEAVITSITFGCNDFVFDLANRAPVAVAAIDNGSDSDYRTYHFSGTQSTDPDGDKLTYSWSVNGTVVSTAPEFLHTFPKGAGTYSVVLTVKDPAGLSSMDTESVTVTPAQNTSGGPLAETGADVKGLAALGGLVAVGSAAGLVANRRRKSNSAA
jgi:hypothetical protein